MGLPTAKSASNYALSHFWKTVIAPLFGCQEVLTLSWNGLEISETTGSVPIGIRYRSKGRKPILYVPRPEAWRLNSITTETVIWLARQMGWEVQICALQPDKLACCNEIWLLGTWTGPGPVTELKLDPKFLHGEPPVPTEVFWDGVGTRYADWLAENFRPVSAKELGWLFSTKPGDAGCELRDAYWALVRNPAGLADLGLGEIIARIPPDWRMKIEPRLPDEPDPKADIPPQE